MDGVLSWKDRQINTQVKIVGLQIDAVGIVLHFKKKKQR